MLGTKTYKCYLTTIGAQFKQPIDFYSNYSDYVTYLKVFINLYLIKWLYMLEFGFEFPIHYSQIVKISF